LRTRQLLERAEQAEAMIFKLLQTAPDALIALDDGHNIKFVNEAARLALQGTGERFIGKPLRDLLPDVVERLSPDVARDSVVPLPDVNVGDQVFSPTLRTVPAGKAFSTIISLRDVTERRRLDARRLDFYSVVAHDLRSPLYTLTLRTQLLLNGKHGELAPGLRADLTKMDANLQSLVEMINDFLDLARMENAAPELHRDEIDLGALLVETMDNLRPQLEARDLSWTNDMAAAPAQVFGDPRRLQQVLTNLISNAVKFTADHGTITTCVARREGDIEVSVADNGRGIPAQNLPTLFQRYARATGEHDHTPGTGLGLMIVREIVEAHGGSVGVESTVGRGSRFWFRVPCAAVSVQ
jgi:two-component system phosphate regulon sensor histidine kinase PhoR